MYRIRPDILSLFQEVDAIAREGLAYSKDPFDLERYRRLVECMQPVAEGILQLPPEEYTMQVLNNLGIVTPRIGVIGGLFNSAGEILVLRRTDDNTWCLPCGWMSLGETPGAAVVREVFEETGLQTIPKGYLAVTTKGPEQSVVHQVNLLIPCEEIEDNLVVRLSQEHAEAKWIQGDVRHVWHPGHLDAFHKLYAWLREPPTSAILSIS